MVSSPIKWHGGKHYLAGRIVALMPPHTHYVEPFAGSLAVLLRKDPEGVSEVVNDLNVDLSNFWTVLQNRPLFDAFHRVMEATPFSEQEYDSSREVLGGVTPDIAYYLATGIKDERAAESVARACAFFVLCRQSLAGRMKSFAPLSRSRTRRGMNEQAAAWLSAVEGLPEVHARLRRVVVLNREALGVIRSQDGPGTMTYCDPPYLQETRAAPEVYAHEMSAGQHEELVDTLLKCRGKVLVSMYHHPVYDTLHLKHGWDMVEFNISNHASGARNKRRMVEVLWGNYHLPRRGGDGSGLFD